MLDPVVKAYFTLNATGELLWKSLEQGASTTELVGALRREFEVAEEDASEDVRRWIAELDAAGLIQTLDAAG